MDSLIEWISAHAAYAHVFLFLLILLAGANIPISVDILIGFAAFLAVRIIPHQLWYIYLAILLGCYFSAWIGYWIGRIFGQQWMKYSWFQRLMPPQRLNKIQIFFQKYGLLTLLIGRFIPFGIRNCIFMSSGMSRYSFIKFAIFDLFACGLWCSLTFYILCILSQNYTDLIHKIKLTNSCIFIVFSVAVIILFWYKRSKKTVIKDL